MGVHTPSWNNLPHQLDKTYHQQLVEFDLRRFGFIVFWR